MTVDEKIWFEDVRNFITADNYLIILPQSHMTKEEKLNSIMRFFLYFGCILAIIRGDSRYLFLPIVAAIVTIAINEFQKKELQRVERYLQDKNLAIVDEAVCVRPTLDNPFMNVLQTDYANAPNRPKACNVLNEKVQKNINDKFNARIFRDVSDVYNNMSSQREFYTMPNTMIPNDQEGFSEFLYGSGPTCKEGYGQQCYQNIHSPMQQT